MVSEGRLVSFEVPRSKPQKTLLCWQRGRQTCSTASILHAECWPAANSHTEPERPQCSFFQIRVTESLEKNQVSPSSQEMLLQYVVRALSNRWRASSNTEGISGFVCFCCLFWLVAGGENILVTRCENNTFYVDVYSKQLQ